MLHRKRLKPSGFRELSEHEIETVAGGFGEPPIHLAPPGVVPGPDGKPSFDPGKSVEDAEAEERIKDKFYNEYETAVPIQYTFTKSGYTMKGYYVGGKQYFDRDGNGGVDLIVERDAGNKIWFDNGDGQGMRQYYPGTEPWGPPSSALDPIHGS